MSVKDLCIFQQAAEKVPAPVDGKDRFERLVPLLLGATFSSCLLTVERLLGTLTGPEEAGEAKESEGEGMAIEESWIWGVALLHRESG